MKLSKILALVLCMTMIAAVLMGCNQAVNSPFVSDTATEIVTPGGTTDTASPDAVTLNYTGALASLAPDTVMLTIDGKDILWDELFYYITYVIYEVESQGGQISDWSAIMQDDVTYKDYVLNSAVNIAKQNEAINYGAKQLNVTLSEQDKADMQADYETQVTSAGSEEAFLTMLQEGYTTKEIYTMLTGIGYLSKNCFIDMYGDRGNKLTDQDVADATAEDGYLMAKHILFKTVTTDDTGIDTPMPDADKAKIREKAEVVLTELKNYEGDDFIGYFDELMKANSEDPSGLSTYPNGYLFTSGLMVSEFEDATKALQINALSPELVESQFGYHIIYRLPINYDTAPISSTGTGSESLRFLTAYDIYTAVIDTWLNSLTVTYSDQYTSLDPSKIFAAQ